MIPTASSVLKLAKKQIGICESPANSNMQKYGAAYGKNGVYWCAQFVWWLGWKSAGKNQSDNPIGKNMSAAYIQEATVAKGGKWIMKKNTSKSTRQKYLSKAKPGDIVSFDFGAMDAWRDHVGIVEKVDGNYLICIEGNTSKTGSQSNGGMVCRQRRLYTSVCSAVRPAYAAEKKSYAPKAGDLCLDLSNHQGKLSKKYFTKIKKQGYKSVILRSSYTEGSQFKQHEDLAFSTNVLNAHKAGLNIGVYHFSQAKTKSEASKEAAFCLKIITPYKKYINLPVAFDWESYKRLTAAIMKSNGRSYNTQICDSFCNPIKKAGFDVMIYASLVVFNNYLTSDIYKKYKIWVAQYYNKCQYKHDYYLWQFTSNNGKLDENFFGKQKLNSPEIVVEDDEMEQILPARGYYKKGDTGSEIEAIQRKLNKHNEGAFIVLPKLTVDGEWGPKTDEHVKLFQTARCLTVDKEVGEKTLKKLNTCTTDATMKAVNFACAIAQDNSFAYGAGDRAHRVGCYFCETNVGPVEKNKERKGEAHYVKDSNGNKHTYAKTYCCNTFITAAYAHGAKDPDILKICKRGSCCGMTPSSWPNFRNVGACKKVPFSKLKPGDVIVSHKDHGAKFHHVWMYVGKNRFVHAAISNWSAKSIAVLSGAESMYKKSYAKYDGTYVLRYRG